ncbi:GtrA family protein [Helicobacter sp. MIT 14-3879]|nr:GtrA family protein [Helicobacter sp. MIT 14-3879]
MFKYSLIKYLLVGVVNTIFGYIIIFTLMYFKVSPEIANFIGYCCGVILSYFLNKHFTFESKNSHKNDFSKFVFLMTIAYLINLIILIICYRSFGVNKYISQVIAGVFYTISGYFLSRFIVFKKY